MKRLKKRLKVMSAIKKNFLIPLKSKSMSFMFKETKSLQEITIAVNQMLVLVL